MRVICNKNHGSQLRKDQLKGNTEKTIFYVTIGKEYNVFSMVLWNSNLYVLLYDDTNNAHWYPIVLFSVSDNNIPLDWHFSLLPENNLGIEAIWGYKEMIKNSSHYEALIECHPEALKIFEEEKNKQEEDWN